MTTFTVACGSLAPGIAAMSEPHVTERGVLALVDYPGALILLPTMFYGLSWGEFCCDAVSLHRRDSTGSLPAHWSGH